MSAIRRSLSVVAIVCGCLAPLSACGDDPNQPYLAFEGGGFVFNYRTARAFYELNVRPMRTLPPGTALEAEFENPAGPPPIIVSDIVHEAKLRYSFRTPALTNIKKDVTYRAVIRVKDANGVLLGSYSRTFISAADQEMLPAKPWFIGPGYQRDPEADGQ